MSDIGILITAIICALFAAIAIINIFPIPENYPPTYDTYHIKDQLLENIDPGNSHALQIALNQIWYECNFGTQTCNLEWLESIRTKYNLTTVHNFLSINYNNPCPISPSLKYLGTGHITSYTPSSYEGPAYSITTIQYDNITHTFNNCRWNPYPYNHSHTTHVFRHKNNSWHNQFKQANLYSTITHPTISQQTNTFWTQYQIAYQTYLASGGINIGDGYN